jgi:hypothetical protein
LKTSSMAARTVSVFAFSSARNYKIFRLNSLRIVSGSQRPLASCRQPLKSMVQRLVGRLRFRPRMQTTCFHGGTGAAFFHQTALFQNALDASLARRLPVAALVKFLDFPRTPMGMPLPKPHDPAHHLLAQPRGARLGLADFLLQTFQAMQHEAPAPFVAHPGADSILAAQCPKILGRLRPHHEFHSLVHLRLGFPRHPFETLRAPIVLPMS